MKRMSQKSEKNIHDGKTTQAKKEEEEVLAKLNYLPSHFNIYELLQLF